MKLYVGNLSWGIEETALSEAFSAYGEVVSVNIIKDRESGRSRGFGFVEMAEKEAGEAAIASMDGAMLDGRSLKVNEARPRMDKPGGRGRSPGGGRRDFGGGGRRDFGGVRRDSGEGGGRRDFGGGDRRDRGDYQGRRDNDRNRDW
jgi:RNA recognition motif-containing protein